MDTKYCTRGLILVAIALVAVSAVVAFPAAAQSNDRFEPNDHSGEAAEIEPGTYEDLRMAEDEWADYYAVELEEGENISSSIAFDHETADLSMALLGPNRYYEDYSFSRSDGESVETTAAEAGTYYVAVWGFGATGADYDLTVETDGAEPEGDRFENNDDLESAAPIEAGEHENLTVSADDRDFYTVDADEGEQIVVGSQIYSADADLTVTVHDPDFESYASSGDHDWRPAGIVANESGTHYVVVTSNDNESVRYDLDVGVGAADRFDPNEDDDSLTTLEPGTYTNLSLVDGPDVDSYQVELVQGERLDVDTTPAGDTPAELFLTNEDGDLVANGSSAVYGDGAGLDYSPNETGTYTVNVVSEDGSATTYDLELDVHEAERRYGDGVYENETVSADDGNRYELEPVDGGEQLAVATRAANQSDDLYLRLEAPTMFITSDTDGVWDGVGHVPDDEASYEVLVRTDSDEPVTYDLYVDDGAADRFDPNEGEYQAAAIEEGTHQNLSLVGPADTDYYELDLEQGQEVSIETKLAAGKAVDLWVTGPEEEQVEVSTSGPYSDDESVSFTAESNGTYSVQAYNDDVSDHDGSTYDLEVEVREPDDTEQQPAEGTFENQTVTDGSPNTYELGSVSEGELIAAAARLDDPDSDLSVTVFGPTKIHVGEGGTTWSAVEAIADSSGEYEVRVSTNEDESVSYDLHLSTGVADEHEPNDWYDKTTIEPGSYGNLTLAGVADQDAYAIDLEAGERLQVDVTSSDVHNTSVFVRNGNGTQFEWADVDGDTRTLTMVANSSGTYGLSVTPTDHRSIEYDLEVDVTTEGTSEAEDRSRMREGSR